MNKESFSVKNKDKIIEVDISKISNVLEQEGIILILNKINEIDENDDPNYIVYAQDVLFSYVGSIYPELLNKEDVNSVACAISLYVDSLFSVEEEFESKSSKYNASLTLVNKIFDEISDSMLY